MSQTYEVIPQNKWAKPDREQVQRPDLWFELYFCLIFLLLLPHQLQGPVNKKKKKVIPQNTWYLFSLPWWLRTFDKASLWCLTKNGVQGMWLEHQTDVGSKVCLFQQHPRLFHFSVHTLFLPIKVKKGICKHSGKVKQIHFCRNSKPSIKIPLRFWSRCLGKRHGYSPIWS